MGKSEQLQKKALKMLEMQDKQMQFSFSDTEILGHIERARVAMANMANQVLVLVKGNIGISVMTTNGEIIVGLSPEAIIVIEETTKYMVAACLAKMTPTNENRNQLVLSYFLGDDDFLRNERSDHVLTALQNHFSAFIPATKCIEDEGLTADLLQEDLSENMILLDGNDKQTIIELPILDYKLPEYVAKAIAERFVAIMQNRQTVQAMKGWPSWLQRIEDAVPEDVEKIASVYNDVMIPSKDLAHLDIRCHTKKEVDIASDTIENLGGFLRPCCRDQIAEDIKNGSVLVVRKESGNLAAFYSIITNPETVAMHITDDLGFDASLGYISILDLPKTAQSSSKNNGEPRKIHWTDEASALIAFQAAKKGKLAYSVDMAVARRQELGESVRRNAQLATACKIANYERVADAGYEYVLMHIFEILAVGKDSDSLEALTSLSPPVRNIRSFHLNETIGAREICTVDEVLIRDGTKIVVRWHYLLNSLDKAMRFRDRSASS